MTDSPITIQSIAVISAIAAAIFGIIIQLLRFGMDYLSEKFMPLTRAEIQSAERSEQCKFDHTKIEGVMIQQNANIAKMLEQNGQLLRNLSESNHAAQLRHEIMLAKIEKNGGRIEDIHQEIISNKRP